MLVASYVTGYVLVKWQALKSKWNECVGMVAEYFELKQNGISQCLFTATGCVWML
jgi:hypothetical protein